MELLPECYHYNVSAVLIFITDHVTPASNFAFK